MDPQSGEKKGGDAGAGAEVERPVRHPTLQSKSDQPKRFAAIPEAVIRLGNVYPRYRAIERHESACAAMSVRN
jgi:hypothetical protein